MAIIIRRLALIPAILRDEVWLTRGKNWAPDLAKWH